MKIQICGFSGSGKSTLARALGKKYGCPVLHMDGVHWYGDWQCRSDEEKTEILKACSDGYEDEFEAVYGGMAEFVRIVFNGGRYFIPQDQLFTEFIEEASAGPNYLVIFIACVTGALLSALGVYILFRVNREKVYAFNRTVDAKISYMKRSVREKISEKLVEMKNNIKVKFFKK